MFAFRRSSVILQKASVLRSVTMRCFTDAVPSATDNEEKGDPEVIDFIKKIVRENKVMLFMKGTPSNPVCGFSLRVVQILKHLGKNCVSVFILGCDFASANILTSKSVVKNLKYVSEWKTYPQLFINGEFVGGCDVVTELFESGELKKMLQAAGAFSEPEESKPTEDSPKTSETENTPTANP